MKSFIISPVRNIDNHTHIELQRVTAELEEQGYSVHLPIRDTNQQNNEIGICSQNYQAIIDADLVCIWYEPNSIGSVFDLGVTVSHKKPLKILNTVLRTEGKSFANMILDYTNLWTIGA
jgi:nucleoside 2-deoxyribosyltransferase